LLERLNSLNHGSASSENIFSLTCNRTIVSRSVRSAKILPHVEPRRNQFPCAATIKEMKYKDVSNKHDHTEKASALGMHTTASAMPPTSHFFNIVFCLRKRELYFKKKEKCALTQPKPRRPCSAARIYVHRFL
jgi:hypothetical protein